MSDDLKVLREQVDETWSALWDKLKLAEAVVEAARRIVTAFGDEPRVGCCDQCDLVLAVRTLDVPRAGTVEPHPARFADRAAIWLSGGSVDELGVRTVEEANAKITALDAPRSGTCPTCHSEAPEVEG